MAAQKVCKVEGCGNPVVAKGLCSGHYKRAKRGIDVSADNVPLRKFNTCCEVCGERAYGHGLCQKHYNRWRRRGTTDLIGTPRGGVVAFVAAAITFGGDECLIWPYARDAHGRARMQLGRRHKSVSRAVCEAVHGAAPDQGMQAAHSCGNGHLGCVNPRHLRWATRIENEADKLIHGTVSRGEINGHAKLTQADVYSIRAEIAEGRGCSEISQRYGVTPGAIRAIKRRKNWAWLE